EVAVAIGEVRTIAHYGIKRVDVAEALPGFPRADQSGFTFTLTGIRPEQTDGTVDIAFSVRTADGKTHGNVLQTYLPPVAPAEPAPLPPPAAEQTFRGLPPLKLEVDSGTVDPAGVLRISGWAVCFAPIVTVQVFIDDKRIGAAHYGQPREDVGLAFP